MAAENERPGYVEMGENNPYPSRVLADALNIRPQHLRMVLEELLAAAPGGLQVASNSPPTSVQLASNSASTPVLLFSKFETLNPPRDISTDRTRRFRERQGTVPETVSNAPREEKRIEKDTLVSKDTGGETVTGQNVKAVFAGLKERRGYASPKGAAEGAAVRQMLKWGLSPEEILECWDQKKTEPFWRDKELWMMTISGQIQAWKANKGRSDAQSIGDTEKYRKARAREGR